MTFVAVLAIAVQPSAQSQTFTSIDYPNGTNTYADSINAAGVITGFYQDGGNVYHGFLRAADGTFTTFDAQGAGQGGRQGTVPQNINPAGVVTGYYIDASSVNHGFVRAADGKVTTIDAPGAGTLPPQSGVSQGTSAASINQSGVIAGLYTDSAYVNHGFVRAANGSITTFDTNDDQNYPFGCFNCGTMVLSINNAGAITGNFLDDNTYLLRGFVRSAKGVITEFDAPNDGLGTSPESINPSGEIVGFANDGSGVAHAFLRSATGTISTFDAPEAGIFPSQGTGYFAINPIGQIAGNYVDASYVFHGFLRNPDGSITTFSAPNASNDLYLGTFPLGINPAGNVTGYYNDNATGAAHGFVWTP